jgi:hypothetical protein
MSLLFLTPNDLEDIAFIAGTEQELTFLIYDSGSSALNLSTSTCTWEMARYGSSDTLLTKTAVVSGSPVNQMVVTLDSSDTENLSGKFIQQPVIVDSSLSEFRPSQGNIQIFPRIS